MEFKSIPTSNFNTPNSFSKHPHHLRAQLCSTRPIYRQGRKLTAVKVYTVNEESQHLLIFGVPAIKLQSELKELCEKYGDVKFITRNQNYDASEKPFTEVYHVQYLRIQAARFAKHMMDDKSFFGSVLHVCYAPERESIVETKNKLHNRKREVMIRVKKYNNQDLKVHQEFKSSIINTKKMKFNKHYFGKSALKRKSKPSELNDFKQFIPYQVKRK